MVYGVWWVIDIDTFPSSSLLTFPHNGGILSWWEYASKPGSGSGQWRCWIWHLWSKDLSPGFPASTGSGLIQTRSRSPATRGASARGRIWTRKIEEKKFFFRLNFFSAEKKWRKNEKSFRGEPDTLEHLQTLVHLESEAGVDEEKKWSRLHFHSFL